MRGALAGMLPGRISPSLKTNQPANVFWGNHRETSAALVGTGAEESFIDSTPAAQWSIPVTKLQVSLVVFSLNEGQFTQVFHCTEPVSLLLSGNHLEEIVLYLLSTWP